MYIYSLIEWCDTDIDCVVHFKDRESLNNYVDEHYKENEHYFQIHSDLVLGEGAYFSNCRGFALEVVQGELIE